MIHKIRHRNIIKDNVWNNVNHDLYNIVKIVVSYVAQKSVKFNKNVWNDVVYITKR